MLASRRHAEQKHTRQKEKRFLIKKRCYFSKSNVFIYKRKVTNKILINLNIWKGQILIILISFLIYNKFSNRVWLFITRVTCKLLLPLIWITTYRTGQNSFTLVHTDPPSTVKHHQNKQWDPIDTDSFSKSYDYIHLIKCLIITDSWWLRRKHILWSLCFIQLSAPWVTCHTEGCWRECFLTTRDVREVTVNTFPSV